MININAESYAKNCISSITDKEESCGLEVKT